MIELEQRWRDRREVYRARGELFCSDEYEVAPMTHDRTAKQFVTDHHYSGSYPAARFRFGLWKRSECRIYTTLAGVAVFSIPMNGRALDCLPCDRSRAVDLGRFVLLDEVPFNGETWFLKRCFDGLRAEGVEGVISFADPNPRGDVMPGHVGTIYQAMNATYLGQSRPRYARLFCDGRELSPRAASKLRNGERGREHVAAKLARYGADMNGSASDAIESVTRRVRFDGTHKYAWSLNRRARRQMPRAAGPYPKQIANRNAEVRA